jgi:hypothetical protein
MTRYTKPALRERLKEEIKASDKGGRPGQWSARKAQLLAREYKHRGGGYVGKKGERGKHLDTWSRQHWQTRSGSADADTGDGMKRYLPEGAWELLSEEQKAETDRRKRIAGRQFVANTRAARAARAYVDHGDATLLDRGQLQRLSRRELEHLAREYDITGRSHMDKSALATALQRGFASANTGMHKEELQQRARQYHVRQTGRKDTLIHEIVHAASGG